MARDGKQTEPATDDRRRLYRAAAVIDAEQVAASPGAILIDGDRIVAAGTPESIGEPADAAIVDLPRSVIMPGLVNAHAHLDLTHVGPVALEGDFIDWIETIRGRRAVADDTIADSVRAGIDRSRRGGVCLIGDIAGMASPVPTRVLREHRMPGVSYVEVFGLGGRQSAAAVQLATAIETTPIFDRGVRLGLQPHAPYSCGPDVYRAAAAHRLPMSTHLAETLEEVELIRDGCGRIADLLRGLEGSGGWDGRPFGAPHPIEHLASFLEGQPVVAAHLNYVEPHHLEMLRRWPVSVAYCPRASAYFGHPVGDHPPHAYRAMLDASINVALGTDSILCLDRDDRITVLDDMRLLWRRDGVDPRVLIGMATTSGAAALGFDPQLVTLATGPSLGVIAVPFEGEGVRPLDDVMRGDAAPRWLLGPVHDADVPRTVT